MGLLASSSFSYYSTGSTSLWDGAAHILVGLPLQLILSGSMLINTPEFS